MDGRWTGQRFARLAAGLWLLFAGVHALGATMTLTFARRLGFWPVWFLDCVACAEPAVSIPYGLPAVGGMSVVSLLATPLAPVVLWRARRGFRLPDRLVVFVLGGLAFAHVVSAWPARYPGSLPPVLVGTVLPAACACVSWVAALDEGPVLAVDQTARPRGGWRSVLALGGGVLSMLLLGGVVSLLAAGAAVWALTGVPGGARRFAVAGLVLAILSGALRWVLATRFPVTIGWLV